MLQFRLPNIPNPKIQFPSMLMSEPKLKISKLVMSI